MSKVAVQLTLKQSQRSLLCLKCENLEFLTFDTCATDDKETPRFSVLYESKPVAISVVQKKRVELKRIEKANLLPILSLDS